MSSDLRLDNMLDIKFYGDKAYYLKQVNWSSTKIEEQISKYDYSGENRPRDKIVENAKLPPIASIFYTFVFKKGIIPDENSLFDAYLKSYFIGCNNKYMLIEKFKNGTIFNLDSLKSRVLRTYPSLIRDFHFYWLCYESRLFDTVSYSLYDDFYNGFDIKIVHNHNDYFISLYTNTKRAVYFKEKKINRHTFNNPREIDLTIDLYKNNEGKKCGNFYLYNSKHVHMVLDAIKKADLNNIQTA